MESAPVNEDNEAINTIWGFAAHKTKIVLSTLKGESREGFGYVSATNEVISFSKIQSLLISSGISYISPYPSILINHSDCKESNLILIGGSRKNEITKKIMQKRSSLVYDFDTRFRLVKTDTGKIYKSKWKDKNFIEYALISKLPNPFNLERTVMVIAGYRDVGTLAVIHFLVDINVMKKIADKYGSNSFDLILEIEYPIPQNSNTIDPSVTIVDPEELRITPFEILFEKAVYETPIVNLSKTEVIPEKKIYSFLVISMFIVLFNSLISLISYPHPTIFLLPVFGSMSILFYLPLRIWKKYRTVTINLTFAFFGFLASIGWFITSVIGIITKILVK